MSQSIFCFQSLSRSTSAHSPNVGKTIVLFHDIWTSVLIKCCSLNCHIWELVQWSILCYFFVFLSVPAHVSCHIDNDPLSMYSFVLSESQRLSACLLWCFVLPSLHIGNPTPRLPIQRLIFFFVPSPQLLYRRKCEQLWGLVVYYHSFWQVHLGNNCS